MDEPDVLKLRPGDDVQMMSTPDAWPNGKVLPLKRDREGGRQLGLLVSAPNVKRERVFHTHMFDGRIRRLVRRGDADTEIPYTDYHTFKGMHDDGWEVD